MIKLVFFSSETLRVGKRTQVNLPTMLSFLWRILLRSRVNAPGKMHLQKIGIFTKIVDFTSEKKISQLSLGLQTNCSSNTKLWRRSSIYSQSPWGTIHRQSLHIGNVSAIHDAWRIEPTWQFNPNFSKFLNVFSSSKIILRVLLLNCLLKFKEIVFLTIPNTAWYQIVNMFFIFSLLHLWKS